MAEMVTPESAVDASVETIMSKERWFYMFGLSLSVMVGGFSSVCIKQLLLPIQVGQIAPDNSNLAFTLIAAVGAFAGLLASPLVGALSDRTSLRYGRRRPWIMLGMATAVVGMGMMAFAHMIPMLLIGEMLAQIGVDTVLAVTTAIIPDQIPLSQRSLISSAVGMAPNVGGVIGLLLVSHFTDTRIIAQGYVLMAAVSLCCVFFFLIILRDPPIPQNALPPFRLGNFLSSFVQPLRARDFALTFASRCCAYLSFTLLGTYTLFYFQGELYYATPVAATDVAYFQLLSTAVLILFAFFAGWFSRRINKIKPLVISGAIAMAIGLAVMVVLPTWTEILLAAIIFGAGFGLFLGVDIALVIRLLPSADARGKDLGLMYDAIYLPLILSPLIGGIVLYLSPHNFPLLFAIAACSAVVSAMLILPIKSVQ